MNAIVYTSNTGYTASYAKLLGELVTCPVYSAEEARSALPERAKVVYFGWLMAGSVKGYRQAAKRYQVEAVCAVGMADNAPQAEKLRSANGLPEELPVFFLQGGLDMQRLHGFYRAAMKVVCHSLTKKLTAKPDCTPAENAMLDMMEHGGSCVSKENLAPVLAWWQGTAL